MTARSVLDGIKEDAAKANPLGSEWAALVDPGDRQTAPAWIVDADDLEVRLDSTYAAGKVAAFIAAAPGNIIAPRARQIQRQRHADQLHRDRGWPMRRLLPGHQTHALRGLRRRRMHRALRGVGASTVAMPDCGRC